MQSRCLPLIMMMLMMMRRDRKDVRIVTAVE